jgi:hypothetical protein
MISFTLQGRLSSLEFLFKFTVKQMGIKDKEPKLSPKDLTHKGRLKELLTEDGISISKQSTITDAVRMVRFSDCVFNCINRT